MQTDHNPREKYSNLIFFLFNALFLLVMFWMLPALGDEPGPSAAVSGPAGLHASTARPQPEKRVIAKAASSDLLAQAMTLSLPKLPH